MTEWNDSKGKKTLQKINANVNTSILQNHEGIIINFNQNDDNENKVKT